MTDFAGPTLGALWAEQRQHTRRYLASLAGADWMGPEHPGLNPPIWEWLHLNWFAEYWCLRHRAGQPATASWLDAADERFNSAVLSHDNRWQIDYPALDLCWRYDSFVAAQLTAAIDDEQCDRYFVQLALHHEAMHEENFMRRAQALRQGFRERPALQCDAASCDRTVLLPAEVVTLGRAPSDLFAFDNELGVRRVELAAFSISRTPVSELQFAEFVAAGGYHNSNWWSETGWHWRQRKNASLPRYWQGSDAGWLVQDFDQIRAPAADLPMRYLNAYEAEAYCAYVGARLPSAAEWQYAYAELQVLPMWEWTADTFTAYSGFSPGPYAEYSTTSFGVTRELRGHSPLLHPQLCRADFRNFFSAQRRDVCAGFRPCVSLP